MYLAFFSLKHPICMESTHKKILFIQNSKFVVNTHSNRVLDTLFLCVQFLCLVSVGMITLLFPKIIRFGLWRPPYAWAVLDKVSQQGDAGTLFGTLGFIFLDIFIR